MFQRAIILLILMIVVGAPVEGVRISQCAASEVIIGKLYQGCFYEQKAPFDNTIYTTDIGACATGWEMYYGLILFEDGSFWFRIKQTIVVTIGGYPYPSIEDLHGYGIYITDGSKVTGIIDGENRLFQLSFYNDGDGLFLGSGDFWQTTVDFYHFWTLQLRFPLLAFMGNVAFNPQTETFSFPPNDLAIFAVDFGRTDCSGDCEGDLDGDGDVDGSDLAVFSVGYQPADYLWSFR